MIAHHKYSCKWVIYGRDWRKGDSQFVEDDDAMLIDSMNFRVSLSRGIIGRVALKSFAGLSGSLRTLDRQQCITASTIPLDPT